ncbi:glycosyltransferase family 9 protein [Nonomuraea sp. NEAU-A123]|uniref:glycosyltransferase family 9 protein n=1 Tax=Nonomuraea sp. NEAU-A123 TaxID=2839649 RepID=UPI0027E1804E|nr:glycosyltransferase family 9 protein [Nonomuraea sp. NEAU-A123]
MIHPGTSAPARTWPAERHRQAVRELAEDGHRVVVTGKERELTAYVAHDVAVDLGGRTTLSQLAALIERAGALVAGNTGPAHLAAAVGTPAVSLFAPRLSCLCPRAPRSVTGDKRAGGQSSEGADQ